MIGHSYFSGYGFLEGSLSTGDPIVPFFKASQSETLKRPAKARPIYCFSSSVSPLKPDPIVCFMRPELNVILSCYGMMVAKGEWRDYAIDMGRDLAVFSIFRHSSDRPLYRLEKNPKLSNKQGAYLVRNDQGRILKRGHDLKQVLKIFDKQLKQPRLVDWIFFLSRAFFHKYEKALRGAMLGAAGAGRHVRSWSGYYLFRIDRFSFMNQKSPVLNTGLFSLLIINLSCWGLIAGAEEA